MKKFLSALLCLILCIQPLMGIQVFAADDTTSVPTSIPTPAPTPEPDLFTDIKGHWAASVINANAKRGILNGRGNGIFEPDSTLTYAEAVAVFVRALYINPEGTVQNHWADPYINAAKKSGIVKDGEITDKDLACSREYAATLASRAAQFRKEILPSQANTDKQAETITDLPSTKNANDVKICVSLGIIGGKPSSVEGKYLFDPSGKLTRAETAAILERLLNTSARIKTIANSVPQKSTVTWDTAKNNNALWFRTAEGVRVADNVLLYQRNSGGWIKNTDMAVWLSEADKNKLISEKSKNDSNFDNNATTEQMSVLAKAYTATKETRYMEGFLKGLDYIFKAQYDNGGWPQYYPDKSGYRHQITYNDNAMIHIVNLLEGIASGSPEYSFVDEARRQQASKAIEKAVDCILKTQIIVNGKKTAWCAQYDEVTLKPATARSYELPSISGSESVGVVIYLMSIKNPSAEIIDAVQSAIRWFNESKIMGINVVDINNPALAGGRDVVVVEAPNAAPIWARFYEIETNIPFFCGRDGIKKYSLAEIELERRTGYSWYGYYASSLLSSNYPTWQKKYAPNSNVLQ